MNRRLALAAAVALALSFAASAQTRPAPARAPQKAVPAARAAAAPARPAPGVASDAPLRAAVQKAVPGAVIEDIRQGVIPGYKEVAIGGKIVYVSADGRYLLQGTLIELASRDNLTEISEGALRRSVLDAVPRNRRIVFSPPNPKYRITVFTDIDCGYCRKMHSQIADYMKAGISVEYLFFPRSGIGSPSYNKAVAVWCAPDRRKALTEAKLDKPLPKGTCTNPVTMDYALGQKIGVDGTPAIFGPDGVQLGGYLSPAEMLTRLDRLAARNVAAR
jgi:thiol:disulfide interchange protein DsbC